MPRPTMRSEYQRGYEDGVAAGFALGVGYVLRDKQARDGSSEPVFVFPIEADGRPGKTNVVIIQDSRYGKR